MLFGGLTIFSLCAVYFFCIIQKKNKVEEVERLYNDFISGEINFGPYNLEEMSIPTGEPEKRYYTDYVIVDSNKDGIPELHIRSGCEFRVFSYKKGEIVNTYSLFSQIFQYTTQNDGTFLYYDTDRVYNSVYDGIRRDYYRAFQVDKGGNEHIESEFYWMDLNENAIYDKEDQYFFDEEECTETEWINLTNKYIYINEGENAQGHAEFRDEVEWTIYCEAVRSNIPVEQTRDALPDTVIGSLSMSMTTDEVSDYLKKCKEYQHFEIDILESIANQIRIWFPNLEVWGWSIVDKTEDGYIANIYNDDIWDETGNAETGYCAYKAQILIKPDWSMELLPDTIEVNPEKGFCIYASGQEFVYNGCELENYHTEYYIEKKNFYLDASVPLFSIKDGLEGNEINRAVWKTLKKWADEQESWVNGEALLNYEIVRLDNDLFSILLSGEWNPEDGETEKIAIGITISMSDGKPLEESVFTGESEKDFYFGYFIKENEIFLIENRGNHYITVKKGDADFKGYFVERKSANVYTAEGEWRGECYFDLLQIYYIVDEAETINKKSKKEMGKFFNGLAQTFQEEIKKIELEDDPSEGPGYYCNVESRIYKNDGKEFGIEYHYKLWLEEIHEEGDAVICFDVESGEILEYQDWQNEMMEKIESWKRQNYQEGSRERIGTSILQDERVPDTANYSAFLKKIWVVDGWDKTDNFIMPVSFVMTRIENGDVEGYFMRDGRIDGCYFEISHPKPMVEFHGRIYDSVAECEYTDEEGENRAFTFTMFDSDCLKVVLDGDETQTYTVVPYNISGLKFCTDSIVIEEVELDSWGRVNLFYAVLDNIHPYPWVLLINEQGDILYQFPSGFRNGSEVKEVIIEDMNGDGLKDVEVVIYFGNPDGYLFEWYFYQGENGFFSVDRAEFYDMEEQEWSQINY